MNTYLIPKVSRSIYLNLVKLNLSSILIICKIKGIMVFSCKHSFFFKVSNNKGMQLKYIHEKTENWDDVIASSKFFDAYEAIKLFRRAGAWSKRGLRAQTLLPASN